MVSMCKPTAPCRDKVAVADLLRECFHAQVAMLCNGREVAPRDKGALVGCVFFPIELRWTSCGENVLHLAEYFRGDNWLAGGNDLVDTMPFCCIFAAKIVSNQSKVQVVMDSTSC